MEHHKECDDNHREYERLLKEFEDKYPNYCRKCGGYGGFHDYGGYWEPPSFDECECLSSGHCPQCGKPTFTEGDEEECSACGWNMENPNTAPEPPECWCDYGYEDDYPVI